MLKLLSISGHIWAFLSIVENCWALLECLAEILGLDAWWRSLDGLGLESLESCYKWFEKLIWKIRFFWRTSIKNPRNRLNHYSFQWIALICNYSDHSWISFLSQTNWFISLFKNITVYAKFFFTCIFTKNHRTSLLYMKCTWYNQKLRFVPS